MIRNTTYTSLVLISLFAVNALANDSKHCDAVLEHGARSFISSMDFETQRAYVYSKACNGQYANSSGDIQLGIEAVIKKVPLGINFGSSKKKSKMQTWCKENQNLDNQFNYSTYSENTVYKPAIEAWEACKAANAAGLKVETKISDTFESVAIKITNDTSNEKVMMRGVVVSNDSARCDLVTDEPTIVADTNTRTPLKPNQSVNVNCIRTEKKVERDNQEISILPAVTVTINNQLTDYQLSLPEQSVVHLTDVRADELKRKISHVIEDTENRFDSAKLSCNIISVTQQNSYGNNAYLARAQCPSNTVMTGGGCAFNPIGRGHRRISENRPENESTWVCKGEGALSGNDHSLQANAICCTLEM